MILTAISFFIKALPFLPSCFYSSLSQGASFYGPTCFEDGTSGALKKLWAPASC